MKISNRYILFLIINFITTSHIIASDKKIKELSSSYEYDSFKNLFYTSSNSRNDFSQCSLIQQKANYEDKNIGELIDRRIPLKENIRTEDHNCQVYLEVTYNKDNSYKVYYGSGTLIAQNVLITAAHVIYEGRDEEYPDQIDCFAACYQYSALAQATIFPKKNTNMLVVPQDFIKSKGNNKQADIGLIIFDNETAKNFANLTYAELLISPQLKITNPFLILRDNNIDEIEFFITGYPGKRSAWTMSGHIKKGPEENLIQYDIDTAQGQSGSAILFKKDNKYYCIGVHAYGGGENQDYNIGVLLRSDIVDKIVNVNQIKYRKDRIPHAFASYILVERHPYDLEENDTSNFNFSRGKGVTYRKWDLDGANNIYSLFNMINLKKNMDIESSFSEENSQHSEYSEENSENDTDMKSNSSEGNKEHSKYEEGDSADEKDAQNTSLIHDDDYFLIISSHKKRFNELVQNKFLASNESSSEQENTLSTEKLFNMPWTEIIDSSSSLIKSINSIRDKIITLNYVKDIIYNHSIDPIKAASSLINELNDEQLNRKIISIYTKLPKEEYNFFNSEILPLVKNIENKNIKIYLLDSIANANLLPDERQIFIKLVLQIIDGFSDSNKICIIDLLNKLPLTAINHLTNFTLPLLNSNHIND